MRRLASYLTGFGLILVCLGGDAAAQSDEIVFWNSVKDSKDGAEFCAYLETYPSGKFRALARLRAKKLGGDCGSGVGDGKTRLVTPSGGNESGTRESERRIVKNRKYRFTRTGWLRRKGDIAETFRMSNQGVTIKWKGGTCTRFKLSSASESLPNYGVTQKSHPLHDGHGSTGIWGIRQQRDPASRYDNFCIRFSKWNYFNCHAMRVEGPLLHYYTPQGDEHRGSGVLMDGDAFEECKNSSFEKLLAKARRPDVRIKVAKAGSANKNPQNEGIVACGVHPDGGYSDLMKSAMEGDISGAKIILDSLSGEKILPDLKKAGFNVQGITVADYKGSIEAAELLGKRFLGSFVVDLILFYDRDIQSRKVFTSGYAGSHPAIMIGKMARTKFIQRIVAYRTESSSSDANMARISAGRVYCELILKRKVCRHSKYNLASVPCD